MTRSVVLNAFSPAQEVAEPRLFAGRHEQLKRLSDALRTSGSCPVIYGDRGLGKSSLAVQCQLIAMGDDELLNSFGAQDWTLTDNESFLTFFVTCSDDVRTFTILQQRILNSFRDALDQAVDNGNGRQLVDRQTKRKISLKFFETETTKKYEEQAKKLRVEDLSLTEQLRREAGLLSTCYGQPVLVVIDEVDRISDMSGLSSFIKALSTDALKFVLVGIAQSLADLDLDHPSIERHLYPVQVSRMSSGELAEIIDRALLKLRKADLPFEFQSEAKRKLVTATAGFPWFIHVIGQAALMKALENGTTLVTLPLLDAAISELVANRFAQNFRDTYQKAVRDSYNREVVLRCFAEARFHEDIPTSVVYAAAKAVGVPNPSIYRGHLCSEPYGQPLMNPGFQERGLLRFRNEMFKQYIRLVPSIFKDADVTVREEIRKIP